VPDNALSICYLACTGTILYGTGEKDKREIFDTQRDVLASGSDVLVEVDKKNCMITFTISKTHFFKHIDDLMTFVLDQPRRYRIRTPLLVQPRHQFVPYYTLYNKGDSVSWELK
jgi:hypothetical protein